MQRSLRTLASVFALVSLTACSGDDDPPSGGGTGGHGGAAGAAGSAGQAGAVCDPHATSAPDFQDRSQSWGLDDAALDGWVLSAGDLNGDGYPDLIAHVPVGNLRAPATGQRYYSVLSNVPADGGGRRFADATLESGYGVPRDGSTSELRVASSAVLGDVDNDGDLDVLSLASVAPPQNPPTAADGDRTELLLNDGSGKFTLALDAGVTTPDPRPVWGGTFADVDLNGTLDAFVATWIDALGQPTHQQLLLGDGKAGFTDASASVGLEDVAHRRPATSVTACDLEDDGAPEILFGAYARMPNLLLRGDGLSPFAELGRASGYAFDDDQDFSDDQWFLCHCAKNPMSSGCSGAAPPQIQCAGSQWFPGVSDTPDRLGGNTFMTACADLTGDGKLDLYNVEIQHWWAGQASDPSALLVNTTDASGIRFARPSRDQTGMHWEHTAGSWDEGGIHVATGDLDNDGRTDVVIGRSDYVEQWAMIFHQLPDGRFEEIAKPWGIAHPCAQSPIVADFDRDGDLDVVLASSRMREWCSSKWERNQIRFYENGASQGSQHLALRLVADGTSANASAIGARVTVEVADRRFVKFVGQSAMSQDLVVFFGLGNCTSVDAIEVRWPDAARTTQRFEGVAAGRMIELRQGDDQIHEPLAN